MSPIAGLQQALIRAEEIARFPEFGEFLETVRKIHPWRFEQLSKEQCGRDYLRVVDHHLKHLLPKAARYFESGGGRVLDFGCGSGGSAVALALVYADLTFVGTDIEESEVTIAHERAKLYGVADRCEFYHVAPGQPLPFADGTFDFCLCSSVLEYAVEDGVRQFCVREMGRLLRPAGLLFCSVPNRLYPFEIHTRKWGWNYFPKLFNARTVDCTAWEVKRLAKPYVFKMHQTPFIELLRPWSAFGLRREA